MVLVPIDSATYSASVPYVTLNEFKNSPTGTDYLSAVPGLTNQSMKDTALAQQIMRASAWVDEICQQVIAATIDWEQGGARVVTDQYGRRVIKVELRRFPVIAVGTINTGADPSSLAAWTGTGADVTKNILTLPIQTPPTPWTPYAGQSVAYSVQYVNGYTNTVLTAPATVGATSLAVANPLGIAPGQTLTLAGQSAVEYVTVASTWAATLSTAPTTVPLASAVVGYNGNGYALGDSVSALPAAVKEAVINLTALLLRSKGQYAIVMASIRQQPDQVENVVPGGQSYYDNALDMLERHIRTR